MRRADACPLFSLPSSRHDGPGPADEQAEPGIHGGGVRCASTRVVWKQSGGTAATYMLPYDVQTWQIKGYNKEKKTHTDERPSRKDACRHMPTGPSEISGPANTATFLEAAVLSYPEVLQSLLFWGPKVPNSLILSMLSTLRAWNVGLVFKSHSRWFPKYPSLAQPYFTPSVLPFRSSGLDQIQN